MDVTGFPTFEQATQRDAAGTTLAEYDRLLGLGVDQFDRVAATVVAAFAHNQAPSWLDGDRLGVMTLRPFGALAVLSIVTSDNAECLARVEVVIRTIASCAALPNCLSSLAGAVAAFERRARAHRGVADDDVVAGQGRNLRLFSVGYSPTPRYHVISMGYIPTARLPLPDVGAL